MITREQKSRIFLFFLGIGLLITSCPVSAQDFSVHLDITPQVVRAGDQVTINLWIDNLVEEIVDHTEFILCLERGIDLICYPFECLYLDTGEVYSLLVSTMTHPITTGHFWYFDEPIMAKVNNSVSSGRTLTATATLNGYCENNPNGECIYPMADADTGEITVESGYPVPEFSDSVFPVLFLSILFFCTRALRKNR